MSVATLYVAVGTDPRERGIPRGYGRDSREALARAREDAEDEESDQDELDEWIESLAVVTITGDAAIVDAIVKHIVR